MYLDESQWRERFQPQPSPYGDGSDLILERSDPRSEKHVANLPHELVWTEYVDYSFDDDDHSTIQNGYVPSDVRSEDLLGWYVCQTPWTPSATCAGGSIVPMWYSVPDWSELIERGLLHTYDLTLEGAHALDVPADYKALDIHLTHLGDGLYAVQTSPNGELVGWAELDGWLTIIGWWNTLVDDWVADAV